MEVSHNKLFSTWLTCSLFPFFLKSVMHDLVDIWKTTWQHLNNVASTLSSSDFKSTTTMKRFLLRRFSVPKRLLLSFKSIQQKLHHFNKCVRKNYSINYVGDVDAESGFDINTPQKNDSNILTAKKVIISYVKNPIKYQAIPFSSSKIARLDYQACYQLKHD